MRKWLRHQLWNVCWEIGDTFMGWSFKFRDEDQPYVAIDIHERCQPKQRTPIITSTLPVTVNTGTTITLTARDLDG